jgi:hypothetical protein
VRDLDLNVGVDELLSDEFVRRLGLLLEERPGEAESFHVPEEHLDRLGSRGGEDDVVPESSTVMRTTDDVELKNEHELAGGRLSRLGVGDDRGVGSDWNRDVFGGGLRGEIRPID